MSTKSWSFKKLFFYTIVVLMLFFLLFEMIFRIGFYFKYKKTHSNVFVQGSTIQMNDEKLVFKNRPFYTDYDLKFQFNEEGMKSKVTDALMPVKTKDDYWVFLFGASAMEGMGSNKMGEWLSITGAQDYKWEETIACLLQKKLQQKIQGKKIRVFCAANSSYNVYQSMLRYKMLSEKYSMDWVISLDGNNEPSLLDSTTSIENYTKNDWQNYPIHHFPVTWLTPFTSHSALINGVKQFIYHFREKKRDNKNRLNNFPARKTWFDSSAFALKYDTSSPAAKIALHSYYKTMLSFDSLLTAEGKKHLLIIQPHLSLKKNLSDTSEHAVYNYYTHAYNIPSVNGFQKKIHAAGFFNSPNIYILNELHYANFPVFVDYCHFTSAANDFISELLSQKILQDQ